MAANRHTSGDIRRNPLNVENVGRLLKANVLVTVFQTLHDLTRAGGGATGLGGTAVTRITDDGGTDVVTPAEDFFENTPSGVTPTPPEDKHRLDAHTLAPTAATTTANEQTSRLAIAVKNVLDKFGIALPSADVKANELDVRAITTRGSWKAENETERVGAGGDRNQLINALEDMVKIDTTPLLNFVFTENRGLSGDASTRVLKGGKAAAMRRSASASPDGRGSAQQQRRSGGGIFGISFFGSPPSAAAQTPRKKKAAGKSKSRTKATTTKKRAASATPKKKKVTTLAARKKKTTATPKKQRGSAAASPKKKAASASPKKKKSSASPSKRKTTTKTRTTK